MKENKINLLEVYLNYLHSLEYRKEFSEIYGDTVELIKMYEELLIKNTKGKIKIKKI